MGTRITERGVRAAEVGSRKYVIFDEDCAGFGLCVYESGRKGFVLIYRLAGRQRWFTIGTWPSWSVTAAREEAQRLKRGIDRGEDPVDGRKSERGAPTVGDLASRFIEEHLPKLEATNAADQKCMPQKLVLPDWRLRKVAEGRARPAKKQPKAKRKKSLKPPRPTPVHERHMHRGDRHLLVMSPDPK